MSQGPPEPRSSTLRQALESALLADWCSVRDLSQQVGLPEKQVAGHLEHLDKSLRAVKQRLETQPATCLSCEFAFQKRDKRTAPGRCPRCRSERISPARFRIAR